MAAAIGVFDGVHRGHRAFIGRLVQEARRRDARSVLVTFQPHPAGVLRGTSPSVLCDSPERAARLAELGIDHLVVERFDATLAAQSAEDFIARLGARRRLVALVMTAASAFGRGRAGNLASMRDLGARDGFDVVQVDQHHGGGAVISSSRIRAAVEAGRLAEAARLLGRRYAVAGTVVHGDARGRTLGFPTANLAFETPVVLPPDGIYAVRVSWGGDPLQPVRRADGVASLGVRPTFGHGSRVLEVFLLDFDEDLYDAHLRVEFVRRQRGERRFTSVERLVEQMQRDVLRARAILAVARP
jgi:riboflavin kinase/FMN adenylyltransferase